MLEACSHDGKQIWTLVTEGNQSQLLAIFKDTQYLLSMGELLLSVGRACRHKPINIVPKWSVNIHMDSVYDLFFSFTVSSSVQHS